MDRQAGKDDHIGPDPHVVLNGDRADLRRTLLHHRTRRVFKAMIGSKNKDIRPHHDIIADGNWADQPTRDADSGAIAQEYLLPCAEVRPPLDVDTVTADGQQVTGQERA